MTEEEVEQRVVAFLDHFFEDETMVAEHELNFLDENGLQKPEIDYMKMRQFIITAYNNLKEMDLTIAEGLVGKMYKDITILVNFYQEFLKKIKISNLVYQRDFLPSVQEYKHLNDDKTLTEAKINQYKHISLSTERELEDIAISKEKVDEKKIKLLRRRNVDALYNLEKSKEHLKEVAVELNELEESMKGQFFEQFEVYCDDYKNAFEEVINTKLFYFEKLLWQHAEQSSGVRKFFDSAGITGSYSTKTYLNYYLRNIDIEKSKSNDWHRYLHSLLKVLD